MTGTAEVLARFWVWFIGARRATASRRRWALCKAGEWAAPEAYRRYVEDADREPNAAEGPTPSALAFWRRRRTPCDPHFQKRSNTPATDATVPKAALGETCSLKTMRVRGRSRIGTVAMRAEATAILVWLTA